MSQLKIYNTLTRQLEEFVPLELNNVSIYVCGPTVYDHAHLGHARCYIIWDVITRYLRFKGYNVTYVRNITDVDDKIINRAKDINSTPDQVAERFLKEFKSDMKLINVKPPDLEPKATEYINEMIALTQKLLEKGHAYEKDNSVYFRVSSYKKYGELSNQNVSDLMSGARVETDENKENPLDFALWKSVSAPDEITWDSPWGKGRPGWHTECCAMIGKIFGETIDIHAGGYDLVFPHHENERAQAECLYSKTFVKYWMHNGFVNVDSEKMSKSLNNFKTVKDLAKLYDSNTIRLFVLTNHYRMPVDFKDEALNSAKRGIKKIKNAINESKSTYSHLSINQEKVSFAVDTVLSKMLTTDTIETIKEEFTELAHNICTDAMCATSPWAKTEFASIAWRIKEFIAAMDSDFNTSKALAILFDLASKIQKNRNLIIHGKNLDADVINLMTFETILLERLTEVLGFQFNTEEEATSNDEGIIEDLMSIIINIRAQCRKEKNWELSDIIRDKLKDIDIILKDHKDGTTTWSVEE